MLSAMEYPHWLMIAGGVLVVLGFVGVAIRKNNALPAEDDLEQNAAPPEERARLRSRLTESPEEFHRPKAKGKQ
jgi:hypothetical protein